MFLCKIRITIEHYISMITILIILLLVILVIEVRENSLPVLGVLLQFTTCTNIGMILIPTHWQRAIDATFSVL